ncbi:hypothetical protein [Xylanimonas cellulosilytica]|nr:hypothetical protein [Xylanimonas cellulosilytica]
MPKHTAWDPRSEGEWTVDKHTCQACAERDRVSQAAKDTPGQYLTVHPYRVGDAAAAQTSAAQAIAADEQHTAARAAAQRAAAAEKSI